MKDHSSCKYWSYDNHPDRRLGLVSRCKQLTEDALISTPTVGEADFDTRPAHKFMFQGMTPGSCTCIVGNYRGTETCPDLRYCPVRVDNDMKIGFAPELVVGAMSELDDECNQLMGVHHAWLENEGRAAHPERQLMKFAVVAAKIFERFLTIHPYIDGNGHCARLLVLRLFTWANFPPTRWDIDAKLDVYQELTAHRRGERGPLIRKLTSFILQSI